jgi:hypothetical protein
MRARQAEDVEFFDIQNQFLFAHSVMICLLRGRRQLLKSPCPSSDTLRKGTFLKRKTEPVELEGASIPKPKKQASVPAARELMRSRIDRGVRLAPAGCPLMAFSFQHEDGWFIRPFSELIEVHKLGQPVRRCGT